MKISKYMATVSSAPADVDTESMWYISVPAGATASTLNTNNSTSVAPVGSLAYTVNGTKNFVKGPSGWAERKDSSIQIITTRIITKSDLGGDSNITAGDGVYWSKVNLKGIVKQSPHKITSSDVGKYIVGRNWDVQNSL